MDNKIKAKTRMNNKFKSFLALLNVAMMVSGMGFLNDNLLV
jgi:hypothetical protein